MTRLWASVTDRHQRFFGLRRISAMVYFAAAFALQGCSWFGDDEELGPAPLVDFDTTVEIEKVWSTQVGKGVPENGFRLTPVIADSSVFAASSNGEVKAVNIDDGSTVWESRLDFTITAGPGVEDDVMVVGGLDGQIVALSTDSGDELWRSQASSDVLASPVVHRGTVVVRSEDSRIYGLQASSGRRNWVFDSAVPALTLHGNGDPVASAGFVYFGLDNGNLVTLRASDGSVVWQEPVSPPSGRNVLERLSDVDGHLALVAGDLYAVGFQGRLRAFAADSGRLLWAREFSAYEGLTADRNVIAVSDADDAVWALERLSGGTLWKQDALIRRQVGSPALYNNLVVVSDFEGYLHFLSVDDGSFVARVRHDSDGVAGYPLVARNKLLIYGRGGRLTAYQAP
ncbi:MAG: outer membrane protein assembly factor BamB [Lysobacterales bacterium]